MKLKEIREMYPEGTQIVLTKMAGESSRLLPPERKPLSLPGKKQRKLHRNQLRRLNRLQRQR